MTYERGPHSSANRACHAASPDHLNFSPSSYCLAPSNIVPSSLSICSISVSSTLFTSLLLSLPIYLSASSARIVLPCYISIAPPAHRKRYHTEMAPLTTLTTTLLLTSAASALLSVPITQNRAVRDAQLAQRSLILRRGLDKRQSSSSGTVTADLGNALQAGLYYANVTVGTPSQDLSLQIDTGSSDVWVPYTGLSVCRSQVQGGCAGGSYDPDSSSTFKIVGKNEFNISYVDGSGVTGDYFTDSFSIGNAKLSNFQMGIATRGTIGTGIMGIGYNNSVANVFTGSGSVYANLPDAMVDGKTIKSPAYSLWLNDLRMLPNPYSSELQLTPSRVFNRRDLVWRS